MTDLLLIYTDRLPIFGGGNLTNIRLLVGADDYYLGAVPIDQVTNDYPQLKMFAKRVPDYVKDLQDPEESSVINYLLEDLPEFFIELLDEEKCYKAIKKGAELMMQKILKLKPDFYNQAFSKLPKSEQKMDVVRIHIRKDTLSAVQNIIDVDKFTEV